MRVTIRGKRWNLIFTNHLAPTDDGKCDAPELPGKEIRIRPNLPPKRALEVLIHEIFHAANFDLSEDTVTQAAEDATTILWKLGYRRELED